MPPALYCVKTGEKYESKEQMLSMRRENDNKKQKIRYWRKKYNYDLKLEDYDKFKEITNVIRYVYKHHDFLMKYDPNETQQLNKEELEIYVKNHKFFKKTIPHLEYIRTLKKLNQIEKKTEPIVITF